MDKNSTWLKKFLFNLNARTFFLFWFQQKCHKSALYRMTKFWLGQMPKNQLRLLAKIQLELQNKNANESETKHERDGMNASVQIGYGRAFSFLLREISCLVKVVMAMTHDILSSAVGTKHLSGYGEHGGGGDLAKIHEGGEDLAKVHGRWKEPYLVPGTMVRVFSLCWQVKRARR